jgi:peptidoglycan/LPS O-acetylase OafA/YrhL
VAKDPVLRVVTAFVVAVLVGAAFWLWFSLWWLDEGQRDTPWWLAYGLALLGMWGIAWMLVRALPRRPVGPAATAAGIAAMGTVGLVVWGSGVGSWLAAPVPVALGVAVTLLAARWPSRLPS